jgi:hypothetical protein|tara:strand:- start:25 stop:273 length:249 start_codon:yes stop_codon:yes gene_type:complete
MWILIISNITWSILGSATDSWFAETKCGIWFYKKINQIFTWSAKKLNIRLLEQEESWKKKYPNVSDKILNLENRLEKLENFR